MKKLLILLTFLTIAFSAVTVSADPHHDWSGPEYRGDHWRHMDDRGDANFPFRWHQKVKHHQVERIYDHEWTHRFPGLRPYRWHGEPFWYHGHRVTNAVLFYNRAGELVSVGFMHNGAFILIRDDHRAYENHDSFFAGWWRD